MTQREGTTKDSRRGKDPHRLSTPFSPTPLDDPNQRERMHASSSHNRGEGQEGADDDPEATSHPLRGSFGLASSPTPFGLHKAAKMGEKEALEQLLSEYDDINVKDQFGSTPLHLACFHGRDGCVQVLLEAPSIDIDAVDVFHRTPVFYAARNGHRKILEVLLEREADIELKTETGETPLIKCSYYGHLHCLRLLLGHRNAKVNEGDALNGNTPLHNVASRGFEECLQILLQQRGIDLNVQNANGYTPVHLAVTYKQEACVRILLENGADVNTKNKNQKSPYEDSVALGFKEISSLLKRANIMTKVKSLKEKELAKWTAHDVSEWIGLIGYPQHKESFELQNISGKTLKSLTVSSLKNELNISSYGDRTTIIKDITKLRREFRVKKAQEENEKVVVRDSEISMREGSSVWHINFSDLKMNELLGKGFFGEVRRAVWKGTEVAVKVIYRDTFGSQNELNTFYKELNIISKLRHPNILMFLGACTQDGNRCLITEYLIGGSLHQLIHSNWNTVEKVPNLRMRITTDILKGMSYLHDLHILHRDLTPKNLLLDTNLNCKVADFGLSRVLEENGEMTTSLGCLPYQAPEVFRGERYSETADVFSFGIVLYELVSGLEPHKDLAPLKYANMVAHEAYRPPLPEGCSKQWEELIQRCWGGDATQRPHFSQLLVQLTDAPEASRLDTVASGSTETNDFDYIEDGYVEN